MDKPNTFSDRVDYDLFDDYGFDRGQKYNHAVINVWIMMTKEKMFILKHSHVNMTQRLWLIGCD